MAKHYDIEEFVKLTGECPLIDVRTPAEFEQGHIPGAVNMPLFSNEERARVGTTYKQVGPEEALLEGLELVGPKMRRFVERAEAIAPGRRLGLHCWRGGRRSASVGWLLEFAGFEVCLLEGGYKAFRRQVLDWFETSSLPLIILGGPTGSGKTDILRCLAEKGEQVVDLEGLAHHKGSAFGALGEPGQPSVEQFQNELFDRLRRLDPQRPVWLENESRAIGRVYIPESFWQRMADAPLLHLEIPLERRVRRLVDDYARFSRAELAASFEKIEKRLGGQHLKAALEALDRDDFAGAAAIALRYYDKAYNHTLTRRAAANVHHLAPGSEAPEAVAAELLTCLHKLDLPLTQKA